MHKDEFEELIIKHEDNIKEIYELTMGISLEEATPLSTIESLNKVKASVITDGVCYNDVMELRALEEISPIVNKLNQNEFTLEKSLSGVTKVINTIDLALAILCKGK